MRFRTVRQEFEAHFHSVQQGSEIHGKSEWKYNGDGTYRFKVAIRDIPIISAGQVLQIRSEQDVLAEGKYEAE